MRASRLAALLAPLAILVPAPEVARAAAIARTPSRTALAAGRPAALGAGSPALAAVVVAPPASAATLPPSAIPAPGAAAAVSPAVRPAAAARLDLLARALAPALGAASKLGSAGAESAAGVGRTINDVLLGQGAAEAFGTDPAARHAFSFSDGELTPTELARALAAARSGRAPAAGLSDEDVRSRAKATAALYKGMPWSQTEYHAAYASAYEHLKSQGATPAQLELFRRLCDEAPVKGGRFNSWSGD